MKKQIFRTFIDTSWGIISLVKKYIMIYVCLVFVFMMHIALPDAVTQKVMGSTASTAEIIDIISSGKLCFYALDIYFLCITCMIFLRLCEIPVTPLKFRHGYTIIELFCSLLVVDVTVNIGSPIRVSDICFFALFWIAIRICFCLLEKYLDAEEKKKRMEREHGIPMTVELAQEVNDMCNLSEYYEEMAVKKDHIEKITAMIKEGFSKEVILKIGYTEEEYSEAESQLMQLA